MGTVHESVADVLVENFTDCFFVGEVVIVFFF
jgi:hypothetical protein